VQRYVEATQKAVLLFLEQSLDCTALAGLAALAKLSPVPIGADEGIHSLADIEAHARSGARGLSLKLLAGVLSGELTFLLAAWRASNPCERQRAS
jgi:L-alanine-DL-glutamate epimerase-like enolase superfamily enzyme